MTSPTLTTKTTIDPNTGNWIRIPVVLSRSEKGWVERFPDPSAGVVGKDAA